MESYNRRTLDPLSARVYFYYSRAYELTHRLAEIRKYVCLTVPRRTNESESIELNFVLFFFCSLDCFSKLLAALCTATLRHNYEGQTTLLNLLLRNYLHYNLYDQAEKFVSKTEFKEDSASSNQLARYYYYQGLSLFLFLFVYSALSQFCIVSDIFL
jgi:26S proteasome regulatory subunit N3